MGFILFWILEALSNFAEAHAFGGNWRFWNLEAELRPFLTIFGTGMRAGELNNCFCFSLVACFSMPLMAQL
jgi:hypothetical protein